MLSDSYAENGPVATFAVLGTNGSNNDLKRGFRCNSSLSCSSSRHESLAVFSAYRRYDSRMSPRACLKSSSLGTRKVIQPDLEPNGRQPDLGPRAHRGSSGERVCQRPLRMCPHFRVSEAEFPTSETMWMNRYVRPRGDFVFEVLQTVHHPSLHRSLFRCVKAAARFSDLARLPFRAKMRFDYLVR
jgi:hypothetical protein